METAVNALTSQRISLVPMQAVPIASISLLPVYEIWWGDSFPPPYFIPEAMKYWR